MDVPADITIIAFFPGSVSVANFLISPQPNTIRVGMCKLKTGFAFIIVFPLKFVFSNIVKFMSYFSNICVKNDNRGKFEG